MQGWTQWTLGIVCAALLVGCGPSQPPTYDLAGKITYLGKPIPSGILYFDPDIAAGADGPQGYALIKQGHYDTREMGQKVGSGKYVVRIYAHDGAVQPELPMGKPLFPERTLNIELPASDSEKDLDVPSGA